MDVVVERSVLEEAENRVGFARFRGNERLLAREHYDCRVQIEVVREEESVILSVCASEDLGRVQINDYFRLELNILRVLGTTQISPRARESSESVADFQVFAPSDQERIPVLLDDEGAAGHCRVQCAFGKRKWRAHCFREECDRLVFFRY